MQVVTIILLILSIIWLGFNIYGFVKWLKNRNSKKKGGKQTTGVQVVDAIVQILVEGLTSLGTGIGTGVANAVQALAFTGTGENQQLSVFFIMVCVFGAIALAVGLTTRIFSWLESLGN